MRAFLTPPRDPEAPPARRARNVSRDTRFQSVLRRSVLHGISRGEVTFSITVHEAPGAYCVSGVGISVPHSGQRPLVLPVRS